MPFTSTDPPDAGVARTLIVRLRRESGSAHWRGQAICVQTGVTLSINLELDDHALRLASALYQLITAPPELPPAVTG